MKISEARAAVLGKLARLSLADLRQPGRSALYADGQILDMIARSLPADAYHYIRDCNALARASLEASIAADIQKREQTIRTSSRRRSRGK